MMRGQFFFMQIHTRHHHGESETPSVAHSRNHPMMNVNNAFAGFVVFFTTKFKSFCNIFLFTKYAKSEALVCSCIGIPFFLAYF